MADYDDNEVDSSQSIQAIVIFEVVGKPKSHVEDSLKTYMDNIKKDARIKVISEDTAEAIEQEDGVFSTFCEAELEISDLSTVVWLAVNFSPASIEILEPANKMVSAGELNAWFNDLLSKVHEIAIDYRDKIQKNKLLNQSMNALIKNAVLTALEIKDMTPEELQKKVGVHHKQLEPFLDNLVERGKLIKKEDKFSLA